LKKTGDHVIEGQTIVEVETDKAILEIEASATGVLVAILTPENTVVPLGATLAVIQP
jgi:pyruvate/2-oxoglutarate dehydrogenase complex dihydrolipoamide acyltransferase (E2) component